MYMYMNTIYASVKKGILLIKRLKIPFILYYDLKENGLPVSWEFQSSSIRLHKLLSLGKLDKYFIRIMHRIPLIYLALEVCICIHNLMFVSVTVE